MIVARSLPAAGGSTGRRHVWRLGLLLAMVPIFGLAACDGGQADWRGQPVEPLRDAAPLAGTNWNGEPFSLEQTGGKVTVVFFGYTFCPDICPFTLAKLKLVAAELGTAAEDLAVVFVSVDPHRDSVEKLANYVPNFNREFYGVRVEHGELEPLQDGWGLTVQYGQPKDGPGTDSFYYVDHTGTYFLIDRVGRLRVTHPPNAKADDLQADLAILLAESA